MRVVLLVTDLERGGTPLRIARLARGLKATGVEVFVGCLAPPGPVSAELAAAGIPTFACEALRGLGPATRPVVARPRGLKPAALFVSRAAQTLHRLSEHVARIRPDVLHATLVHANVAARLIGLMRRIPVLTSTATIEVERPWHRWVERLTARTDRGHIVNSSTLAEHVARSFWLPRRHVRVVPPSLDEPPRRIEPAEARAALGIPPHEFVVAWVGRFDPVKRLDLVVRVAEIMAAVPSRFLLAGEGPARARVEQILRLSNAGRSVHLLGWRRDVGPVLSAADAFLFPSLTEGMPNAVLEAMAVGVPIVASDLPALRELSGGGERILLVRGDQPKDFADALLKLRADAATRHDLAAQAAAWAAKHLDPRATVEAVLREYRRVVHPQCV